MFGNELRLIQICVNPNIIQLSDTQSIMCEPYVLITIYALCVFCFYYINKRDIIKMKQIFKGTVAWDRTSKNLTHR
jgi:hypothetical protein